MSWDWRDWLSMIAIAALIFMAASTCAPADAAEFGYGVVHHLPHANTAKSARGWELRANFGGRRSTPDRPRAGDAYRGDRWSVSVTRINDRAPDVDEWIKTPLGCCGTIYVVPEQTVIAIAHRWYSQPRGNFRFFFGTGFSYRDTETCVVELIADAAEISSGPLCWDGSAEVSSAWSFRQSFGFKWRIVEVSYEHDSTARISAINSGEDQVRLGLFAQF